MAEPDVYAAEMLAENSFPDERLLRIRLLTDGGYLDQARTQVLSAGRTGFTGEKDRTEFIYREARLEHKAGNVQAAKSYYLQVIEKSAKQNWYFGASSALQLGYLFMESTDYKSAQKYFEMAIAFGNHPYKNSIDGKAKAALDRVKAAGK